jgi:hypothetical protein
MRGIAPMIEWVDALKLVGSLVGPLLAPMVGPLLGAKRREKALQERARRWQQVTGWVEELADRFVQWVRALEGGEHPLSHHGYLMFAIGQINHLLSLISDPKDPRISEILEGLKQEVEEVARDIRPDLPPSGDVSELRFLHLHILAGRLQARAKTLRALAPPLVASASA